MFYGQFTSSGLGADDLTVTVDITRVTRSNGTQAAAVTGGSATQVTTPDKRGLYLYVLTGADLQTYDYAAVFVTTGTADLKEVPALWSRFSEAVATDSSGFVSIANPAAVWDLATSGHTTAGTFGAAMAAAGAAGDPLSISVPGSYTQPQAGWVLGQLLSADISYAGPVNPTTGSVTLTAGDDYYSADGRALTFALAVGSGIPSLSGATVSAVWYALASDTAALTVSGAVSGAGGENQAVTVELSAAQTATLSPGAYKLVLRATLSNSHIDTLTRADCSVLAPRG